MRGFISFLFLGVFFSISSVNAADRLPVCNDNSGQGMPVDNERVIRLKKTTKNQYRDRANVVGVLVGVLQTRKSHLHLDIFLGEGSSGTGRESDIEVIYNREFGDVQGQLRPGMEVAACGDFINAFDKAGRYPPSPVGAILHWVHMAPRPPHQSGFLAIDGKLYGQNDPHDRMYDSYFDSFWDSFFPLAN